MYFRIRSVQVCIEELKLVSTKQILESSEDNAGNNGSFFHGEIKCSGNWTTKLIKELLKRHSYPRAGIGENGSSNQEIKKH